MKNILTKNNTIIFIALLTLWRIYLTATMQLHPDEAYYWLCTRHLDLSYYDHPPMAGYFIWLTTLFWESEFWVRFSGLIVSIVLSILAWLLSKQFFEDREDLAAASVMILNIYPVTMTGSILITPDSAAFLFWALSIYFYWQVFRSSNALYWYLGGAAFGLGLLSKYTVVLLAPLIVLFMLMTEEKKWLKTIHPYLSWFLSAILFLPVIIWNSRHEWISFKFQLSHGLGGQTYQIANLLEYFGGQLLVVSPFLWILGFIALILMLFKRKKEYLYISLTSLPIILFFGYSSLKKTGEANWPALSYFTFTFALSWFLINASKWKKIALSFAVIICFSMSMLATIHARFGLIPLAKISGDLAKTDATNWFYGYKELVKEIEKYSDISFIVTPSHQLSAELIYYTNSKIPVGIDERSTRFSQFNYWNNLNGQTGKNGLYVYAEGDATGPYSTYFSKIEPGQELEVMRNNFKVRQYHVIKGFDLKPGNTK